MRWDPIVAGGSSPRVWGTGILHDHGAKLERFIPTCVGNGSGTGEKSAHDSVHPHVCGERLNVSQA